MLIGIDNQGWMPNRGLQCFKLSGNQTENVRYLQKKTFYFLQNV